MSTVPLEEYLRVSDELEAMRDVVEAVQALADEREAEWGDHLLPDMRALIRDLRAALAPVSSSGEDNPEHDPGTRPNHRPGSFLDKRDRRGVGAVSRPADPITATSGATPLGNISSSGGCGEGGPEY